MLTKSMNAVQAASWVAMACMLAACAATEYPVAHKLEIAEGVHSLSYTADLRAVHLIERDGRMWVLAEPPPDAAFSYDDDEGIDLSLLSFGGNEGGDESVESSAEDLPMVGRTAYVALARELSYRLAEASVNMGANFDQYATLQANILGTVKEIAKIEAANLQQSHNVAVTTGSSATMTLARQLTQARSNTRTEEEASSPAPQPTNSSESATQAVDPSELATPPSSPQ